MVADDFSALASPVDKNGVGGAVKKNPEQGLKREWLKVYETMPPQMLNAYGAAKFQKLGDRAV